MKVKLTLSATPGLAPLHALSAELGALRTLAASLELLAERALKLPDLLVKLTHIDNDVGAAAAAGEVPLAFEASDRALRLLAALRAGNADLRTVEIELRHLCESPLEAASADTAGCAHRLTGNPVGESESPAGSNLAGDERGQP